MIRIGQFFIPLFFLIGCAAAPAPGPRPLPPPKAESTTSEPILRVRIVAQTTETRLGSTGPVLIADRAFNAPVRITRRGNAFYLTGQGQSTLRSSARVLPVRGTGLSIDKRTFPGTLELVAPGGKTFDVVNHVPLESYLPGVLDKELYASWAPAAFEAQAVAARSYALWEVSLEPGRHFDLESTTASQVYGGAVTNRKALDAVARTRGRVLTYEGRVLPAFFSSTTGGRAQDAVVAFPSRVPDLAPLRGGPRGSYDAASGKYRWGPIRRSTHDLAARMSAWGRENKHAVAHLKGVRSIAITHVSRAGRPAMFRVTDGRGQTYNLYAEHFRFAANHDGTGLPKLDPNLNLPSSDLRIASAPGGFVFTGQGFGHGVGLSQWGAQGMALQGFDAPAILAHYYPGARIEKLYE